MYSRHELDINSSYGNFKIKNMNRNITLPLVAFIIINLVFLTKSNAQFWHDKISKDTSTNFNQARNAYYNYWNTQNQAKEKYTRWKQFKRWENKHWNEVDDNGNYYNTSELNNLYKEALFNKSKSYKQASNYQWKSMGPDSSRNGIGRVNCISFSPVDSNIIYVGAPSGGFWRSYNHGQTWETTTDAITSIGISGISIPPDSPQVIYISTGDKDLWDSRSIGVLKSNDGGTTWNETGLSFDYSLQNRTCGKVIINPQTQSILHVYSNEYYYRSLNSGKSFTSKYFEEEITALAMHPNNPNILYLGTIRGKLYRTIDGGNNWLDITNNIGYPNLATIERLTIATNPTLPNSVYILSQGSPTSNNNAGVYVSKDEGNTFQKLMNSGVGWYGYTLAASQMDTNLIFVGGSYLYRTLDYGLNWILVHNGGTNFLDSTYLHIDMHDLMARGNNIYVANDGGIALSNQKQISWKNLNGNLAISEVYGFSSDEKDSSNFLFGSQDIGAGGIKSNFFNQLTGGDGMECKYDRVNSNTFYLSSQNGAFYKTMDGGLTFNYTFFNRNNTSEWGAWTTPIIVSKFGDDTVYIPHENLYKTTNKGQSWVKLTNFVSPPAPIKYIHIPEASPNKIYILREWGFEMFKSVDTGHVWQTITKPNGVNFYNFTVSTINTNRLFATVIGLQSGKKVYQSNDAGNTWINITANLPNINIYSVVCQKGTKDRIFIGTELGVYFKDSTMSNWVKFGEGLPNSRVTKLEIHEFSNSLRASTYGRGVWQISLNGIDSLVFQGLNSNHNGLNNVNIYPNPTTDKIHIELPILKLKTLSYSIVDLNGKKISEGKVEVENDEITIDVRHIRGGEYVLVLQEIGLQELFIKK